MNELNQAQYFITNPSSGTTATTIFQKIRIDEKTLEVYGADFTFARTSGYVPHHCSGGGCLDKATWIPYGVARDCTGGGSSLGHAIINLRGTGLAVSRGNKFVTSGYIPAGRVERTDDDQKLDIFGGGHCGWTIPTISGLTTAGWSLCLCVPGRCAEEDVCTPKDSSQGIVLHSESANSVPTGEPCKPGVTYEVAVPTSTTPRVCKAVTECVHGETRETAAPTINTDRICSACRRCYLGDIQLGTCDANSDYTCREGCTICIADEYLKQECTDVDDAVCIPCTVCGGKQFTVAACSLKADTRCADATLCSESEYELAPLTDLADRVCRKYTVCEAGVEFEEVAPTKTADRRCHRYQLCPPGTYVSVEGTPLKDRECSPCVGGFSTGNNVAKCTPWTNCAPGTMASAEATALADRVCTFCALGHTFKAGIGQGSSCQSVTTCVVGETFESVAPTTSSDRSCSPCDNCDGIGNHASNPCTLTRNTVCSACGQCDTGSYASTACSSAAPPSCVPCTLCDYRAEYEVQACQPDTNRVCAKLTLCTNDEIEVTPASEMSDRVCQPLRTCLAAEYEAKAPVALGQGRGSSQRVCQPITQCNLPATYDAVRATATSDAVCLPTAPCVSGQYELRAPAPGFNRICAAVTECRSFEYQAAAPSRTSDVVCERCHSTCTQCFGGSPDDCIACGRGMYLDDGMCVSACAPGFVAVMGACVACHGSCAACLGPDSGDCQACKDGLVASPSPEPSRRTKTFRCDEPVSDGDGGSLGSTGTTNNPTAAADGLSTTSIALIAALVLVLLLALVAILVSRRRNNEGQEPPHISGMPSSGMQGFDNPIYDAGGMGLQVSDFGEASAYAEPAHLGTPETHLNGYMDVTAAAEEDV